MANKFSKGHTFVPGEVVDPADLNELVDLALPLNALISDQTVVAAATNDHVLITDASDSGNLKQALVSSLPSGTTSVDFTAGNPAPTTIFTGNVSPTTGNAKITFSLKPQTGNKFLASPVDGSNSTPLFRVISPVDLPVGTQIILSHTIDWSLGSMFMKQLTANETFIFTNASHGQTIRVLLYPDAPGNRLVAWPATPGVRWPNGTNPVQSPHGIDLYTFHFIGGVYHGTFDQNFAF